MLVNASSADKPTKAQVIAQRNLAGGGDAAEGRATSPLPPSPADQTGNALDDAQRQIEQMQVQQMQLLTQLKRELARLSSPETPPAQRNTAEAQAEEERRRQLIDQLAQIERRINDENARPRRRYVSPSAREGVHAIYYDTLRSRIEDIGTRNFPEDRGVKLYGELTMLLEVDSLGRVVEAEIVSSSGNRLLDRKAQSIVRGAGPYGHFTRADARAVRPAGLRLALPLHPRAGPAGVGGGRLTDAGRTGPGSAHRRAEAGAARRRFAPLTALFLPAHPFPDPQTRTPWTAMS